MTKNTPRIFISLLLMLLCIGILPVSAFASSGDYPDDALPTAESSAADTQETKQIGTVTTNGGNLNVRTGAGLDNTAFTQLPNGTVVDVIGRDGDWVKILLPARVGYVYGSYLTVTDAADSTVSIGGITLPFDEKELADLWQLLVGSMTGGSDALTPDGNLTLIDDIGSSTKALENERAVLKRRLTIERRRLEENRHLMGGGFERAVKLIGEARQVGLIDSSTQVDYQNYQEVFSLLQDTLNWSPQMVSSGSGMDRLTFLQSKLQEARNEYDEIGVSLDNARKFVGEASGYSSEAQHQKVRLESIGLFEHIDFDPGKCPLCSGTLENPLPSVEMIRTSIVNLDKSIANVTREQPKLRAFISTLEQERQKKQEEIRTLEAEIDGIYQQEDERARLRDINARKGKVVGRISLWVESVQNDTESEQQEQVIREIEKRVQEIDSILDTDSVDERKQSALSRIQEDMTKWAKELQLEHCDNPYRLDLNKVTVIVDKPERPVPLKQLGSGSNWVGVHLIAYFALQHYFIGAKRPVPRFMFLDQPSQVYFPSEFDEKKTDWNEVNKIYQFVIDRTTELQGQLQVIIVDHADLKKDSFREFIRENWWPDDKNLIPIDWYKSE